MFESDKLLAVIQKAARGVYDAKNPCNVVFGRIVSLSPVTVKIGDLTIPQVLITVCGRVKDTLTVGDAVVLLRAEGGQRFVLLDTVGGKEEMI